MSIAVGKTKEYDYIVIGQGIAGTFLSWHLIKAGKTVLVIDEPKANSASHIASGVINPVTGRRLVQTWKIDQLLPFARQAYEQICDFLQIPSVLTSCSVLDFHSSEQMGQAFESRLKCATEPNTATYVHEVEDQVYWKRFFEFNHGMGAIFPALLIDLEKLLGAFRQYLRQTNCLLETNFDWQNLTLLENQQAVRYQLDGQVVQGRKILCCEGMRVQNNPYFNQLPFRFNKGEALLVAIDDLPRNHIYKLKYSLVPWGQQNLFWVGSTYQWAFEHERPTLNFREEVEASLKATLKLPFTVKEALAAVRPASEQRRPFAGLHPTYTAIGILNGLGTKGCSLSPFYSGQLADYLENGHAIDVEADVRRCF